jgi:hypothetical protein
VPHGNYETSCFTSSGPEDSSAMLNTGCGVDRLQDFLVEDRPISAVEDHLTGVTGGAEGDDSYASFFLLASLRALTPR